MRQGFDPVTLSYKLFIMAEDNKTEQDLKIEQLNYPAKEDIFENEEHIPIDGDGNPVEESELVAELTSDDPAADLDIPGAELDDDQQELGSEDEENNYWSLGGDNHDETQQDNI